MCEAIKADGLRCTYKCKDGKNVCGVHKNTKTTVSSGEPWILEPDVRNGKRIIQRIRTKLLKGPKTDDEGGTIYVYYIQSEAKLSYYKVGMTRRDVDKRMEEWADEHDTAIVVQCTFVVERNLEFIEKLIHTYLTYCNLHRTPHKRGLHSVLSLHGTIMEDGQQHTGDPKDRMVAKNKFKEWFASSLNDVLAVIIPMVHVYGGGGESKKTRAVYVSRKPNPTQMHQATQQTRPDAPVQGNRLERS